MASTEGEKWITMKLLRPGFHLNLKTMHLKGFFQTSVKP